MKEKIESRSSFVTLLSSPMLSFLFLHYPFEVPKINPMAEHHSIMTPWRVEFTKKKKMPIFGNM